MAKRLNSILFFISSICFFAVAIEKNNFVFYPLACCFFILGITNWKKDSEK